MKKVLLLIGLVVCVFFTQCTGVKNNKTTSGLENSYWLLTNPETEGLNSFTVFCFLPDGKILINSGNGGDPSYEDQQWGNGQNPTTRQFIGDYQVTGKLLEISAGEYRCQREIIFTKEKGVRLMNLVNSKNIAVLSPEKPDCFKDSDPFKGFNY